MHFSSCVSIERGYSRKSRVVGLAVELRIPTRTASFPWHGCFGRGNKEWGDGVIMGIIEHASTKRRGNFSSSKQPLERERIFSKAHRQEGENGQAHCELHWCVCASGTQKFAFAAACMRPPSALSRGRASRGKEELSLVTLRERQK